MEIKQFEGTVMEKTTIEDEEYTAKILTAAAQRVPLGVTAYDRQGVCVFSNGVGTVRDWTGLSVAERVPSIWRYLEPLFDTGDTVEFLYADEEVAPGDAYNNFAFWNEDSDQVLCVFLRSEAAKHMVELAKLTYGRRHGPGIRSADDRQNDL